MLLLTFAHSPYLFFIFVVLTPMSVGASVSLTFTGTAANQGLATNVINDQTYELKPYLKGQSKMEILAGFLKYYFRAGTGCNI